MSLLANARLATSFVTKHTDIVLIGVVVAVLSLMIVPLPTALVDLLISANLAVSFLILMMTMYVPSILGFSSFPSLLLFTTLFRVGLNIATTRLILLQADAGEIIYTFGEFAVGGNFIVGSVVFIIIAIIQFLVIAKGAERVSEVGARFTLDAMPGKQMSIDADLRSGSIDAEEAQRRRNLVTQESQMYGAMDGAMKFVKGDAIAGLLIAAVNVVAGTIIGITQMGMSASDALNLYGVLTIGDGLVSQIPSLLIAISSGILVTRSGDKNNLGELIGDQVFSQPRAIYYAGGLVFLFGLIPGFPKPQLFSLAAILIGMGYVLKQMSSHGDEVDDKSAVASTLRSAIKGGEGGSMSLVGKGGAAAGTKKVSSKSAAKGSKSATTTKVEEFSPVVPLILDLSSDLSDSLDYAALNEELTILRNTLYFDLGVPFPGVNLREHQGLSGNEFVLNLNEIPIFSLALPSNAVYVREDPINLDILSIPYTQGKPLRFNEEESLWVDMEYVGMLYSANIKYLSCEKVVAFSLSMVLARHVQNFVGLQEAKFLMDKMEERAPDLVHEAQRLLPIQRIADLLNRLVQEQVSIRDMRTILESIIVWAPKEKDQIMLCEYIRSDLKRQISYKFCGTNNILPAIIFDPAVEDMIRNAIRQTSSGSFLSLDPQSSQMLMGKIREALKARGQSKVVIIVSLDIRRYVRKLIEAEFYEVAVLDYQELVPQISVQAVGRVRL